MSLALLAWAVFPFGENLYVTNINVGILYLFAVSSLGVYGIIMAGWASNSKYPFLGALRSAAQMVSYEVSIGIIMTVLLCVGSLNLNDIVIAQKNIWFAIPLFPMFVIFFISALAETNRPPFDLPEAEAELVSGYQTEYSGMMYAMFLAWRICKYIINVRTRFYFISRGLVISIRLCSIQSYSFSDLANFKNSTIIYFICLGKSNCTKI